MRSLSLVIVFAAFQLVAFAQDKPVHLFILSGQSNMAGLKPETSFIPEAEKLLPDAEVVHMKVAKGGQPIRLWVPEWNAIAEAGGIGQRNDKTPYYEQILAAYQTIEKEHGPFASISFCWMQGERDAKSHLESVYEASLKQLIANLRRDLKRPDLNVVIGRISDHTPGPDHVAGWDSVRKTHVKVANDDPHGAWVDTDDLNNKEKDGKAWDDLHYTGPGYKLFGQRLARQAVRLIEGQEPA
tara:strand:- start:3849 stop:4571 length:723 start_codon:yes stop_codon:yes gene_type:complete